MNKLNFVVDDFCGWSKFDYSWLLIACFSITAITVSMDGSLLSIVSAISNVVCVILVAQGKVSNYLWGTVGVITYAYLAWQWGFYGDTFLNAVYYLPMQFVGFYFWNRNKGNIDSTKSKTVFIQGLTNKQKLIGLLSTPLLISITAYTLFLLNGKLVFLDATSTVLSIIAMLLMTARMKEQWILWIVVNVVSIYMWVDALMQGNSDGVAILLMWVVFLLNSVYGAYKWFKEDIEK